MRHDLHTLYVALLHVRAAKDVLKHASKQRPLTAAEHEQLDLLHHDHHQLQQQLEQLVSELWQLLGEASDEALTVGPREASLPAHRDEP